MPKIFNGHLSAQKLKIAIVFSRFNHSITQQLLNGALDTLKLSQCPDQNISLFQVPGALEIAPTVKKILSSPQHPIIYDAIICLGTIIKGDTPHFEYVSSQTAHSISFLNLHFDTPIIFGILTTHTLEQASQRAGAKHGNYGSQAALAAVEMANLFHALNQNSSPQNPQKL